MIERLTNLRMPIRIKLTATFIVVTIFALGAAIWVARTNTESALLESARTNQQAKAQSTVNVLDQWVTSMIATYAAAGQSPELRDYLTGNQDASNKERARGALSALARKDAYHESVSIVNMDGTVVVSSVQADEGASVKARGFFQDAIAGRPNMSEVAISNSTNQPSVHFTAPVRGANGQPVGAVVARLSMGGILSRIAKDAAASAKGGQGMLIDEHGVRLAMSDSKLNFLPQQQGLLLSSYKPVDPALAKQWIDEKRFGPNSSEANIVVQPDQALAAVVDQDRAGSGSANLFLYGKSEIAYASLESKPWKFVVFSPSSIVTAAADKTTQQLTTIGVITAVVAAGAALIFSLQITSPIVKLAKAADAVSMGDVEQSVDIRSNDEIGDLAGAFGRMVASIRFYMSSGDDEGDDLFSTA